MIYSEILDMQEYGYKEIGHLSRWKLGGQLLRGWFDMQEYGYKICRFIFPDT
jgi:hypothetical protein